ncbi:MAG: endonuclease I [Candidatus Cloacimonadota bacterium]|nr:MAG: endonuclease I [Candidatus Cloacimonadota bacterium]
MKYLFFLLIISSLSSNEIKPLVGSIPSNLKQSSFGTAKKKLLHEVYPSHQKSIYCGCDYKIIETFVVKLKKIEVECKEDSYQEICYDEIQVTRKKLHVKPDLPSCGYEIKGSGLRANRIEWEHVVPAHHLAHAWDDIWKNGHKDCITAKGKKYKGRRCVQKVVPQYKYMQADMHNLYPSIGEINGYRRDYQVAIIPGEVMEFGKCDVEIFSQKFEPAPSTRGEVARTYFYMDQAYGKYFDLNKNLEKMLKSWAKSDPPNAWECERNLLIANIQGNENQVVTKACDNLQKSTKESEIESTAASIDNNHFKTLENTN